MIIPIRKRQPEEGTSRNAERKENALPSRQLFLKRIGDRVRSLNLH